LEDGSSPVFGTRSNKKARKAALTERLPSFITPAQWIWELGFGAGVGLSDIQRCANINEAEIVRKEMDPPGCDFLPGRMERAEEKESGGGRRL
jgi:hypothetical protein